MVSDDTESVLVVLEVAVVAVAAVVAVVAVMLVVYSAGNSCMGCSCYKNAWAVRVWHRVFQRSFLPVQLAFFVFLSECPCRILTDLYESERIAFRRVSEIPW